MTQKTFWGSCRVQSVQAREMTLNWFQRTKMEMIRYYSLPYEPIEGSYGNKFPSICNHCGVMAAGSRKTLETISNFLSFYGKVFKILFRKDLLPHRSTYYVHISWNLAYEKWVKSCVAYLTKNENSSRSPVLAAARIAPKICQGQPQTMCSERSRFHPKRFTFGGVISERVTEWTPSERAPKWIQYSAEA